MKSPQFFLQDEQGKPVDPVMAVRCAQMDAILLAIQIIGDYPRHKVDQLLADLVFELAKGFKKPERPTEQELREEKEEADFRGDMPQPKNTYVKSIESMSDEILDEDHT